MRKFWTLRAQASGRAPFLMAYPYKGWRVAMWKGKGSRRTSACHRIVITLLLQTVIPELIVSFTVCRCQQTARVSLLG